MWQDPIVEEVRRVREAHAAQYGFDLRAIFRAIQEQETASGRTYVMLSQKRVDMVTEDGPSPQE